MERVAVEPQVTVKDENGKSVIVDVGPLDWAGVKSLVECFRKADLPLPDMTGSILTDANGLQSFDIGGFITANMPVLRDWIFKHPPIISALVVGATGLSEAQIDTLSAGQLMRTARASWKALVDDGFFSEVGGFFGDLLPLGTMSAEQTNTANESHSEPVNGPTSSVESKSESEPSSAGV